MGGWYKLTLDISDIIDFYFGKNDDEILGDIAAECRALARKADEARRKIIIARSENHVDN